MNEFIVHFFIMQKAGYKHLGLAPYYIASRIFAKIKNRAFAKIKKKLSI